MIKKLLLVDDELDFLEIATSLFEINGFEVGTASSGKEGLKYLQTERVDLVISDINMPNGDGLFLLQEYTKLFPTNPPYFIFATGYNNFTQEELQAKGAYMVMQKPFAFETLLEKIKALET